MTGPTGESRDRCRGFWWVGQQLEHCDNCGRDIREHDGLHMPGPPFSTDQDTVLPFAEAMVRVPLFAHYVTPIGRTPARPFRWEGGQQVAT